MPTESKPCCVCGGIDLPKRASWEPCCLDCASVYHACFTSVDEGILALKSMSLADLQKAFYFEFNRVGSRKSMRVAIARAISKKLKSTKSKNQNT
jgi:hypothetical protein